MPTLAVCGCSYSDYTMVDKVYGEYCAEDINYDYLHLARGGSSNQRMFYKATRAIEDKQLVSGDIIVLQYTNPHRKILPTYLTSGAKSAGNPEKHDTPYGPGWTTDYKIQSHTHQPDRRTAKAHLALDEACFNAVFETDYLITLHQMFEALCKQHSIHLVIFQCRYVTYLPDQTERQIIDSGVAGELSLRYSQEVRDRVFREASYIHFGSPEDPSPYDVGWFDDKIYHPDGSVTAERLYDFSHLSDKGHETIGLNLSKHLQMHSLAQQA